jgi:hypothetical protein
MTTVAERPTPTRPAGTRWAWSSGPCRALEHTFEVVVEDGWSVEPLAPVIAPFRVRGGAAAPLAPKVRYEIRSSDREGQVSAYAGDERLATGRSTQSVLGGLSWHINRSVIEHSVDRYVLMHAAAATLAGVTVVLAADMESGKTTTVAGLLRSGFDYVTDEAVALDPETGRVSPFSKTLSLDPGSWKLFPECAPRAALHPRLQWYVEPHRLGSMSWSVPVAAPEIVLFPKYVAGATTEVLPVSRAEAAHEMARMTFDFARHPRRNLATAARVATTATCARLRIGDLDEAVELVHELVSQRILDTL